MEADTSEVAHRDSDTDSFDGFFDAKVSVNSNSMLAHAFSDWDAVEKADSAEQEGALMIAFLECCTCLMPVYTHDHFIRLDCLCVHHLECISENMTRQRTLRQRCAKCQKEFSESDRREVTKAIHLANVAKRQNWKLVQEKLEHI